MRIFITIEASLLANLDFVIEKYQCLVPISASVATNYGPL